MVIYWRVHNILAQDKNSDYPVVVRIKKPEQCTQMEIK